METTKRAVVLFALSLPIALAVISFWPEWWFASAYYPAAILALLVADVNMSLPEHELTSAIDAPVRIPLGRQGQVDVRLEAAG